MEPKLSDGDLILVDQAQVEIADGITYVIRLGNDLLVKYVQRISPDAVSLLSENNRYPPREISLATIGEDTAIIGRVVASMHEW
ncbi:putative phage repressor [Candidatus Rhodobacter oscarellae]|uniref:Putative phage repressor n=2 Tax=Candidatus Rhodobacter oscarellae TaxID=1675527 RepID=A0A0J9H595_9RHOB|nr:putative phage repressor [Candidatus Rhodobacter lobularis]